MKGRMEGMKKNEGNEGRMKGRMEGMRKEGWKEEGNELMDE